MGLWVAVIFTATSMFAAETLKGRVVKVSDGDTIMVLDVANVQHKIRLDKIDAPEKAQPFGDAARKIASSLIDHGCRDVQDGGGVGERWQVGFF